MSVVQKMIESTIANSEHEQPSRTFAHEGKGLTPLGWETTEALAKEASDAGENNEDGCYDGGWGGDKSHSSVSAHR
jgi:hypothetical protein